MSLGGDFRYGHPTGWFCPQCQRVNAPFVQQCPCTPATVKTITATRWPGADDTVRRAVEEPTFVAAERAEHLKKLAGWPTTGQGSTFVDNKPLPTWGV